MRRSQSADCDIPHRQSEYIKRCVNVRSIILRCKVTGYGLIAFTVDIDQKRVGFKVVCELERE